MYNSTFDDMESLWKKRTEIPETDITSLASEIGIPEEFAELLLSRGIRSLDEAKTFFNTDYAQLHSPWLMDGMEKAVDAILERIQLNKPILVYGDYDVDGTTAVSLVYSFLSKWSENVAYYIPDRYSEGYGISERGVRFAADNGFELVVALDCGIRAIDQIRLAKELGVNFIVCDHHLPGSEIPDALSILNPKKYGCNYPYKELSGCAIGFKLIQALADRMGLSDEAVSEYLDLVAISLACDIVPLNGENRILTTHGLNVLGKSPRPGIQALLNLDGIERPTMMDVLFGVGPRINAAGRMEHAEGAVKLLLEEDLAKAEDLAKKIDEHNQERKAKDRFTLDEAMSQIEVDEQFESAFSTVVYNPDWHKGVIGIVASRLIERHYRPTIVFTLSNGLLTGSARSIDGFNIHDGLEACSEHIEQFGGHSHAAGLSIRPEKFVDFQRAFEAEVRRCLTSEQLVPIYVYDCSLKLASINPKFVNMVHRLEPTGPNNPKPLFRFDGLIDAGGTKRVGGDQKHLKLRVMQEGAPYAFNGIAFNMGDMADRITRKEPFSMLAYLDYNVWNGTKTIQLRVKDIRFSRDGQ